MSLVNLPENFLYQRLPAGLIALDERGLIQAVVTGYQDRLEDLRSYGKKFQLFFSPVGLPEAGPNVVFVDVTTDQGKAVTRSLDITSDTPTDPAQLLDWASAQLGVGTESLANARYGLDLLRLVDANILDYLASNIGAVLYKSSVAENQPVTINSSGTFTATQLAHQKLIETFFPRLKFKGTARSFEALGKLLGFDDVRMVPLWGRVSPRLPNDPGSSVNDPDFAETPEYFPQQELNPFYDPHEQRDGVFYNWSGTVANGTASNSYYPQVINGFQPWVKFEADLTSIQQGTLTPASAGTYLLAGGAPHCKAIAALPSTGTFTALGEGESWNGVQITVSDFGGTLRRLDIDDRLSAIKYRTSFYDLGITMDADKADALFGTLAARPNTDLAAAPHAYVSWSGTLYGTSPYRPFTGGTAAFRSTTGVYTDDFLTPFAGTVSYYRERTEAGLADAQQNFTELAKAGQGVTQAMEEVRAATRQPRKAGYGYLQDDTVMYAPIQAEECVASVAAGGTVTASGTFANDPLEPYRTGMTLYLGDQAYPADNRTDSRWPERIFHEVNAGGGTLTGFTVPLAGSYQVAVVNNSASSGTACVDFYGTLSPVYDAYSDGVLLQGAYPNTHEVVRSEAFTGTQVFAVVGDYGLAANMAVGQPAYRVALRIHDWHPEIIVTVGDNNYYNGDSSTIAANNEAYWPDIQQGRFFPTLGNHDLDTDNGTTNATYFFNGTVPGNGRYYNVRRGNVEFFVLNTGWATADIGGATGNAYYTPTSEPDGNTYDSIQGQWLKAALRRSTALWKIVTVHEPPFTSSTSTEDYSPGYPRMRWPFREWGATAVMSGHNHAYERLVEDGLTYIICGFGGETNRVFDNVYIAPGSIVRYKTTPGPTNYGAVKIVATESFIRFEALNANPSLPAVDIFQIDAPDKRYMERPEDELDDSMVFETMDEYPYRRDILGGGELIEMDFYSSGTAVEEFSILEQTMAVKDQTEVDHDVYVAIGGFAVPQFKTRVRPLPYKPGQRAICFKGQFRNQASLGPDDLDLYPVAGGRTDYFHSDLDNVFQPGYQLFHAGLVSGVLVADADKFNGVHHLQGLEGWLPFNEHPESNLTVSDAALSLAQQSVFGIAPQDRVWDAEQGFSLQLQAGALVTSTASRGCEDDLTLSFWIKTNLTGGVTETVNAVEFGSIRFQITWSSPAIVTAQVFRVDTGWTTIGFGHYIHAGEWSFVYLRKQGSTASFGAGLLNTSLTEDTLYAEPLGTTLLPNTAVNDIFISGGTQGPWQIRDLRVWRVCKTVAELELVKYHAPVPTVVPYRVGHVLALNSGDRYGLQVLPNGWLAPSNMPAWVRSPKFAKVMRYQSDGAYKGEEYRKEVGLGGGQLLPNPWKLGEQFYSMTANGTVAVSPQLGAMPGNNAVWDADTAPGFYIVLSGSTSTGTAAVVTASGSGANPWPNRMEATNPVRESIWLDNGSVLFEAKLQAAGGGAAFVATSAISSNQYQGDAAVLLATSGTHLTVTSYGSVVQAAYVGTVVTPPLFMYLHETLLEDVGGPETLTRWTDPTSFGLSVGAPALKEAGELSFTNSSTLRAGKYKLKLDLGNIGKPDDEFDGFRIDITFAEGTTSHTLLQGLTGNNLRGQEELLLTLENDISSDWLLSLNWINSFSDPARGVVRQLVVYGYQLRRLETNLYQVSIALSGTDPDLTKLAVIDQQFGTIPGGWLVGVNSYGTIHHTSHEGTVYPSNDTTRSQYPLANLLTGVTAERREDVISAGTFCLPDYPEPEISLTRRADVSGQVTDATSSLPVASVTVQFTDAEGVIRIAYTDASGNYSLSDLATGPSAAYVWKAIDYLSTTAAPTLVGGANVVNFVLTRKTKLSGTITNSVTGDPLAGALVGLAQPGVTFQVHTDANGFYVFENGVTAAVLTALVVSKTGYTTDVSNPVIAVGWNVINVALVPANMTVTANITPPGSATITGLGTYVAGSLVTLTAFPTTVANEGYADIVFIVDESGSMFTEHGWLGCSIKQSDDGIVSGISYIVQGGAGIRYNSVNRLPGTTFTGAGPNTYTQLNSLNPSKVYMNTPFVPNLLEAALAGAGVGVGANKNRYALTGFGGGSGHGTSQRGHKHVVGAGDFGTAAELVTASDGLVITGSQEDAYEANRFAVQNYTFRPGAARLFITITDEHRTSNASPAMNATDFENAINSVNGIVAGIFNLVITDTGPSSVIGMRGKVVGVSPTYKADGVGGYTTTLFSSVVAGPGPDNGNVVANYVNPFDILGGSEWDLNKLRNGGFDVDSFSTAFVDVVKGQIIEKLTYVFDHWVINGVTYFTNPVSFTINIDTVAYLTMTTPP